MKSEPLSYLSIKSSHVLNGRHVLLCTRTHSNTRPQSVPSSCPVMICCLLLSLHLLPRIQGDNWNIANIEDGIRARMEEGETVKISTKNIEEELKMREAKFVKLEAKMEKKEAEMTNELASKEGYTGQGMKNFPFSTFVSHQSIRSSPSSAINYNFNQSDKLSKAHPQLNLETGVFRLQKSFNNFLLLAFICQLSTVCCLLSAVYYQLSTVCCLVLAVYFQLLSVFCLTSALNC